MRNVHPCCCISLKTGGFLIGILEIVAWSINLFISGFALWMTNAVDQTYGKFDKWVGNNTLFFTTDTEFGTTEITPSDSVHKILTTAYIITSLCLTLSVVRIFIAGVLLLGIQKNNLCMIKSWFIVKILVLFLTIALYITSLVTTKFEVGDILYYVGSVGVSTYFLWVIFELIIETKENINQSRNPKFKI